MGTDTTLSFRHSAADLDSAAAFFAEHGFVAFDDLLGDGDVARLRDAYDECVRDGTITQREHGMVVENDAIHLHPTFREYVEAPRIVEAARAMLGGVPIELQHCKIAQRTLEDSGEGALDWHQDYPFFPHSNYDLVAVLMHIDEETVASGPVQVVPGSHHGGPLSHVGADGAFSYEITTDDVPPAEPPVLLTGRAGQVTMHHGCLVHGSARKTNRVPRRILIPQYRAQDAVQLAGVMWRCTGHQVMERVEPRTARLVDGTIVELRGNGGRLYDQVGQLAPSR
jgi:ectoine hydroxylase-related dioxygenase (phytanoyl-CoA dioxygenase family)